MIEKILSTLPEWITKQWLVILGFFLALGALSIFHAFDGGVTNDSWWHLKTGEQLWQGTFSFYDSWSWTANGDYWPAHELGFEWILYGLWKLGGESFILMALLNIFLVLGSLLLLLPPKSLREKFNLRFNLFIPILLFAIGYTTLGFIQIRAQAISFLLFALTVRLILAKRPYWIPLVFLIWVYLHGSVFVGVAALGLAAVIFIGRWILDRADKAKAKDALHFSIAGILSLVATCLSPLGFGLWGYFVHALSFGDTSIGEWQPLTYEPKLVFFAIALSILLGLSVWRLWSFRKNWELIFLLALSLFLLVYCLNVLRIYSNFALAAFPIITIALMSLFRGKETSKDAGEKMLLNRIATGVGSLILVVSLLFSANIAGIVMKNGSRDPFEANGVASTLRSDQCKDSLWNDYDTGSYLIWFMPDIKVSTDSRFDPYPRWVHEAAGVIIPPGGSQDPTPLLNEVLKNNEIKCMVMSKTTDSDALEERGLKVLAENRDMIVFDIPSSGIPERKDN